jgi:hypothetical protein
MTNKQIKSLSTIVLLILILANIMLLVRSSFRGSFIALIIYMFVTYLWWRKDDFRAIIIVGIVGFMVHLIELILLGISILNSFEVLMFFINLILPLLLLYFGYRAYRNNKAIG